MAQNPKYPALAVIFLMLLAAVPFANPEDASPVTITTFSDGSSEANLTFPDGGGWDNSTSITVPAGVRVTGANVTLEPGAVTGSGSFAANASELAASGQIDNLTLRGDNLTLADGQFWWGQNLTTTFNDSELERTVFKPGNGITLEKNYNSQTILTYQPEFVVAGQKDAIQPKIVMDTEGNSIIIWIDARTGNYNVYAKILTKSGTQFGPEIVVCDAVNNQETPAMALNPSNLIFIAWTDQRISDPNIYGRIYQNDGTPTGPEFVICNVAEQQTNPAVAAGPNGNFIVAWQDLRSGHGPDIYGKIYTPNGTQNGSEIAISTISDSQTNPDIAVDSNNNFIVTWDNGGSGNPTGIYARRYHEDGTPYGAEFTVRTGQGDKLYPTVAFNSSNNFTIAWGDYENPAADIYARRYDSAANPIGDYFTVVSEQNSQIHPQLAVNSKDTWILAWNDYRNASQHNYVKRFNPTWTPIGQEALVSSFNSAQYEPAFSVDPNNDEFLIVWPDYRKGPPDVYAQRMGDPYQPSGIVLSPTIDFSGTVLLNLTTPADTGYSMSVINDATNATLQSMVQHGDFANNAISGKIKLRLVLSTNNGTRSPTLSEWGVGTRCIDVMDNRLEGYFNNTTINDGLKLDTIKFDRWTQLASGIRCFSQSAVWDTLNNRMLVFGGMEGSIVSDRFLAYWPSNNTWENIPLTSNIPARYHHTAVWDDQNNQMLIYGGIGSSGQSFDDIKSYDPATNTWHQSSGSAGQKYLHSAAWNSATKQMYIFGGLPIGDDLWAYTPSTSSWYQKSKGPSARYRASFVYDPVDDLVVLYGGYGNVVTDETWFYYPSNDTWVQKRNGPDARFGHTGIWDPIENRMLVYGGNNVNYPIDVWSYIPSEDNWTKLTDGPGARVLNSAVWDTANTQMLIYAGDSSGQGPRDDLWSYKYVDDAWFQKTGPGFARAYCAAAWDPDNNQMLMFGGTPDNNNYPSELWAYKPSMDSWERKAYGPPGRNSPTMVWDSDNHELLLFGGAANARYLNDLWSYNPGTDTWTQRTSADYTRCYHSAIYDSNTHQMIVFGGLEDNSPSNGTIAYSPASDKWTRKADAPDVRYFTAATWDPDTRQMLVFGGKNSAGGHPSEVLMYSPSQNRWQSQNTIIPGRYGNALAWDTQNHCMLVFGGYMSYFQNDLWSYDPETRISTYLCSGATPRHYFSMAWDSTRNHLLVYGGLGSVTLGDLWSYGVYYMDSGSFVSTPKDLGYPSSIGPISWNLDWPKPCYVVFSIRSSHANQTWSAWENISNGFSPVSIPTDRYIQYRIEMSTVNNTTTPVVYSVNINYSLPLYFGRLLSSFSIPGNNITDAACQLNAYLNGGNITVFLSSDNGTSWLPAPANQSVHFPEPSDTILYRIQMKASPDGQSPVLQSIFFQYDCPSVPSDITIVSGNCSVKVRPFQQETLADISDLFGNWSANATEKQEIVTLSVYSATAGTLHLSSLNLTYVTVPVFPGNHLPVISDPSPPDNFITNSSYVELSWSAVDQDDDPLIFEILINGTSEGMNVSRPYRPRLSWNTSYTWQVRAFDTHEWAEGPVWHFTTPPYPNYPPHIELQYPPDENFIRSDTSSLKLKWYGHDLEGDPITYTVYLDLTNASTAIATTNASEYTVQGLVNDTVYYWKVAASDGMSAESSDVRWFRFFIGSFPNHSPAFNTTALPDATVGKPYQFRLTALDADNDTLIFALFSGPAGMTIDVDGTVRWKPTSAGTFQFTTRVSDGKGNDTKTFSITVNAAPKPPVRTDQFPWAWLILVIIIIAAAVGAILVFRRRPEAPGAPGQPPEAESPAEPSGGDLALMKETKDILAQLQTELAAPSDVLKLNQAEELLADTSNPQSLQQAHAILTGLVASLKDTAGASESKVEFLSEVEFYAGYVRLKAAIINRSESVITDSRFKLIYDQKSLRLSRVEPEYPLEEGDVVLGNINPGEKRTAAFYLDPLICTESALNGIASFKDSRGNLKALTMKPKKAAVVCPIFHTEEQINVAMLKRMTEGELTRQDRKAFKIPTGTTPEGAFDIGKGVVGYHDVRLIREFIENKPYAAEAWYFGKTKPAGRPIIIRVRVLEDLNILEFFVACDDKRLLTGLLAELAHNLVARQQATKAISSPEPVNNEDVLDQLVKVKPLLSKLSEEEVPAGEIDTEPQKPASALQSSPVQPEQPVVPILAKTPVAPILPKQEPAPEARAVAGAMPAGATRIVNPFKDETMALKTLSNIPRGLPGSLSGRSMDELAEELVLAQFAETEDGDTIVKLGKKWYFGDPKQADTYLQPFK